MLNYALLMVLHLIGDFYLQSDKVARCKNARVGEKCNSCTECKKGSYLNVKYVLIHSLIYVIPFLLLALIADAKTLALVILILAGSHAIVDAIACWANKKTKVTVVFLIDQAIHSMVLYLICRYAGLNEIPAAYAAAVKVAFVVLLLMAPCSILVNKLMEDTFPESVSLGLFDVGSIIGILERVLVVVFAYLGELAAIAIIITVKTWARTADLQDKEFRNRYLLGTLASLVSAVLVFMLYKLI